MRPGLSCVRPWLSRFSHRFAAVAGALQRLAERGDAGRYGAFCCRDESDCAGVAPGAGRAGESAPALHPALGFESFCGVAGGQAGRDCYHGSSGGAALYPYGRGVAPFYWRGAGIVAGYAV